MAHDHMILRGLGKREYKMGGAQDRGSRRCDSVRMDKRVLSSRVAILQLWGHMVLLAMYSHASDKSVRHLLTRRGSLSPADDNMLPFVHAALQPCIMYHHLRNCSGGLAQNLRPHSSFQTWRRRKKKMSPAPPAIIRHGLLVGACISPEVLSVESSSLCFLSSSFP